MKQSTDSGKILIYANKGIMEQTSWALPHWSAGQRRLYVRLCTRALRATTDTRVRATVRPVLSGSSSDACGCSMLSGSCLLNHECTFGENGTHVLGAPPQAQIRRVFRKYIHGWGATGMTPFQGAFLRCRLYLFGMSPIRYL